MLQRHTVTSEGSVEADGVVARQLFSGALLRFKYGQGKNGNLTADWLLKTEVTPAG